MLQATNTKIEKRKAFIYFNVAMLDFPGIDFYL